MTNADGSALRLAGGDERKRPPMGAAHLGVVHRFLTKPSMDWAILGTPYPPVAMTRSIAPSDCAAALLRFLAISTSWSPMPGGRCDRSFFGERYRIPPGVSSAALQPRRCAGTCRRARHSSKNSPGAWAGLVRLLPTWLRN